MTPEQAAREFVKQTRDESGPAHDPHSLLVGFLAGATWEREAIAKMIDVACSLDEDGILPDLGGWDNSDWYVLDKDKVVAAIRARTQAATGGD